MFLPSCSGTVLLKELEMPPAQIPAALLAIALWVAPCFGVAALAAGEPARTNAPVENRGAAPTQAQSNSGSEVAPEDWRRSFTATLAQARALLESGYERAPTLVIVLGAFLVLPAVALVSFVVQSVAGRRARHAAIRAAQLRAADPEQTTELPTGADIPLWSQEAWLTVQGGGEGTVPLAGRLVRIGRHQDNDLRLPDTTVHRHHAVIERTRDEEFVITDLSGEDGNGVRINGTRQSRAQLTDGDVIELGRTRLKFESTPA
jgi:Inner membrane component of T3SS, cytoplasmic domain